MALDSLEFTNLPLAHVSIRLFWKNPISKWDLQTVNAIADGVRGRFPTLRAVNSRESSPLHQDPVLYSGAFPGVEFTSEGGNYGITLQDNALFLHWNRSALAGSRPYPRFLSMEEDLWWFFGAVESRVGAALEIGVLNMRYVNFINSLGSPANETLYKYLGPKARPTIVEPADTVNQVEVSWKDCKTGIDRRLQLISGEIISPTDSVERGQLLTTTCGVWVADTNGAKETLLNVHLDLQRLFLEIISEEARKEWGYVASH